MPLMTKNITKTLPELDLSGNKPSVICEIPKLRDHNPPVPPLPLPTNEVKATNEVIGNNKTNFLTLPVEIRLQIYDILLISRYDRKQNPSWAVGNTNQKLIMVGVPQDPRYRTIEPGILRTCKQIYHEANSTLYSQNKFAIANPKEMIGLVAQFGLVNLKLIRNLRIWVEWYRNLSPWLQLFHILADEASGLRCIELVWDVAWDLRRVRIWERGLGDNLDFVRALGKIKGLKELVIKGYYAKNWPAYLSEKMDVQVQAICGLPRGAEHEQKEEDLNDEELGHEKYIRDFNKNDLQQFRDFQQGTECLIP